MALVYLSGRLVCILCKLCFRYLCCTNYESVIILTIHELNVIITVVDDFIFRILFFYTYIKDIYIQKKKTIEICFKKTFLISLKQG